MTEGQKYFHLKVFTLAHPQHNLVANWFLLCQSCQQNNIFITKGIFIISEIPLWIWNGEKLLGDYTWQILMWYLAYKAIFDLPLPKNGCWTKYFSLPNGACQSCNLSDSYHIFSILLQLLSTNLTDLIFYNIQNKNFFPKKPSSFLSIPPFIFCNLSESFSLSPTFPNLKGTKEPLYGYSCLLKQLFIFYDLMPFANALKCIFLRKKRELRSFLWCSLAPSSSMIWNLH